MVKNPKLDRMSVVLNAVPALIIIFVPHHQILQLLGTDPRRQSAGEHASVQNAMKRETRRVNICQLFTLTTTECLVGKEIILANAPHTKHIKRERKEKKSCGPVRRCLCKHKQIEGGMQADSVGEMFSFILFRRNRLLGLRSTVGICIQRAAGGGILLS